MTKRNKVILFSATLLAVCVIASAVILLIQTGRAEKINVAALVISGGAVLCAIFSILFVYLTKVRRKRYEKLLNDEFYEKCESIREAVEASQISGEKKSEIKNDILDLLLSAQNSGKTAENTVGDPQAFSKEVIRSFSKPWNAFIHNLLDAGWMFLAFVLCIQALLWLENMDGGFFSMGIDGAFIGFLILIVLVVIPLTKGLIQTGRTWGYIIPLVSGVLFIAAAEILRAYFYGVDWIRAFLDGTVILIPNAAILAAYLVLLAFLAGTKIWLRKNRFRKL